MFPPAPSGEAFQASARLGLARHVPVVPSVPPQLAETPDNAPSMFCSSAAGQNGTLPPTVPAYWHARSWTTQDGVERLVRTVVGGRCFGSVADGWGRCNVHGWVRKRAGTAPPVNHGLQSGSTATAGSGPDQGVVARCCRLPYHYEAEHAFVGVGHSFVCQLRRSK